MAYHLLERLAVPCLFGLRQPKPLHLHPATKKLGYKKGSLPNSEKLANKVLALPHHQNLSKKQIIYVCDKINKFYN